MTFKQLRLAFFSSTLLAVVGCVPVTGLDAPSNASLIVPEELSVSWNEAYDGVEDGYGALFLMDVYVFDTESERASAEPMPYIQVELISGWSGVYLLPQTAVKYVAMPDAPEDGECDTDGDGAIDAEAPDECSWYWDTSGNTYIELAADFADAYSPTYMIGATDERGLLRSYVYIDYLPPAETGWTDTYVTATIGHEAAAMTITVAD